MENDDIQVDTLPISRVDRMDNDDIQVDTLSLSTHCPGIESRMTSSRTRGSSMQQDSRFTISSCITNLNRIIVGH